MERDAQRTRNLVAIKLLHTVIWGFFVACILAIPVAGALGRIRAAAILSGIVMAECLILAANRCRCPLTDVAARYTDERTADFDIYLPLWLARHNKTVFGAIFVAAELFLLWRWLILVR